MIKSFARYTAITSRWLICIGKDLYGKVSVDMPFEMHALHDTKGLYARARRGEIKNFTGIDDPYEPPRQPEIRMDTVTFSPEENAISIF